MKNLLRLVVIVVIAVLIWKKGIPWWEAHRGKQAAKTTESASGACVSAAEHASELWGSGIGRFANNPDLTAWGEFRTRVDVAIAKADAQCGCDAESCRKAHQAMGDLRGLVSELDGSIRSGSAPPGDIVQRQEQIDNTINEARAAVTP